MSCLLCIFLLSSCLLLCVCMLNWPNVKPLSSKDLFDSVPNKIRLQGLVYLVFLAGTLSELLT